MAQELVRIYLKSGQTIEFEADEFWVDRGGEKPEGGRIGHFKMGTTDTALEFIDLAEVAAVTKTLVRSVAGERSAPAY